MEFAALIDGVRPASRRSSASAGANSERFRLRAAVDTRRTVADVPGVRRRARRTCGARRALYPGAAATTPIRAPRPARRPSTTGTPGASWARRHATDDGSGVFGVVRPFVLREESEDAPPELAVDRSLDRPLTV